METLAIIPARYGSSRFPGKPLALVRGKPMIERVYRQAAKAFRHVCVATDDSRIYDTVTRFGGIAAMTSPLHQSGTDRSLEALKIYSREHAGKFDIVINVQGDEPFIRPEQLLELKECFNDSSVNIATLVKKIETEEELLNSNTPKVVIDKNMNALYFSRTQIPFARDCNVSEQFIREHCFYKHIGLYGYRSQTLEEICSLPQSYLEKTEKLEQLRWLENGYRIRVAVTGYMTHAVDTPQDLEYLNSDDFRLTL